MQNIGQTDFLAEKKRKTNSLETVIQNKYLDRQNANQGIKNM